MNLIRKCGVVGCVFFVAIIVSRKSGMNVVEGLVFISSTTMLAALLIA